MARLYPVRHNPVNSTVKVPLPMKTQPPEFEEKPGGRARMNESLGLALSVPATIVAPFVAGYFLDRWLGTAPWLLVVCALGGLTSGGLLLYRIWKMMGDG